MTLKEFADALSVSRNVAAKVAAKVPRAEKKADAPGQIARWVLPADAVEHVSEEMLDDARQELQAPPSTAPGTRATPTDPALRDETLAVDREKLAVEKIRAETERLAAEAGRAKAERDLEAFRTPKGTSDPLVADRLARVERALETLVTRREVDPASTMTEFMKAAGPFLVPLVERLASPAPPPLAVSSPPLGVVELLALTEKIKGLVTPPESNFGREVRVAFNEGVSIGRERAGAEAGDGGGTRTIVEGIVKGLAPYLPEIVEGLRGLRGPASVPAPGAASERALRPAPTSQPSGGDEPMSINPLKEILDARVGELKKPAAERDLPGVAGFLESIVLNEDGDTLLDRLAPLARTPDRLAQISARLVDPRLVDPAVWPGVRALLDHLSGADTAQPPAPAPAGGSSR